MLFRFDPFEQFERFDRQPSLLAMDAVRGDDRIYVYFDAPGMGPDDVNLTIEKNAVTVEATRRWYDADMQTLTSERPQGSFKRQLQFGDNVDLENVKASLDNGVLTLEFPLEEGSTPRNIEIRTGAGSERELEPSGSS